MTKQRTMIRRESNNRLSGASSASSTSATVQYAMDSILPTTEDVKTRKMDSMMMSAYDQSDGEYSERMDDDDDEYDDTTTVCTEEEEVRTPKMMDRSVRRNQIEHSIKRRLDKMSQQLEEWKHRHDDLVNDDDNDDQSDRASSAPLNQRGNIRRKSPVLAVVRDTNARQKQRADIASNNQSNQNNQSNKEDLAKLQSVQQELTESKKENERLKSRISECQSLYQKAKKQGEVAIDLRHKLNAKNDECKKLVRTIKAMVAKEKEHREKEKSNALLQKRYNEQMVQIKDLKKQIDDYQTQVQGLQSENADINRKMKDKEDEHREAIQQLEQNVQNAQNAQKEASRASMNHKEQIERIQRDLMEWKQTCKELNDDLDRVKREHSIKLKSADDVLNQKLSEVLDREKKYKDHNRTLQKKVEELIQKSLVNEQYLTDQIEWKTKYEQESTKWRSEKLEWANERLDMEGQLKKLKEIQDQTQEGIRSDIEKYKTMIHKERFMRESLEEKILELNNTLSEMERKAALQREISSLDALKTEDYSQKLTDIRRTQRKLEQNHNEMQQRLASYMHKYNHTLREMSELKNLHSKAMEQLNARAFKKDSFDSDSDGFSDDYATRNRARKSLKDISDLQEKCDHDVKEYKSKMSSLIKDMTTHGQEISGLRQAFQMLKAKMSALPQSPEKKATRSISQSKRSSMLNNYNGSSDDERFDMLTDDSDTSSDDELPDRLKPTRLRSRSADLARKTASKLAAATALSSSGGDKTTNKSLKKKKSKSSSAATDFSKPTFSSEAKTTASSATPTSIKKKK